LSKLPGYNDYVALLPIAAGGGRRYSAKKGSPHGELLTNAHWADPKYPENKRGEPVFFTQQAGWMGDRNQILAMDRACRQSKVGGEGGGDGDEDEKGGGFLPPFDQMVDDGIWMNVEFWSGGFQLFGSKCQVQRVLFLEPSHFSSSLLWHQSNNKQRTLTTPTKGGVDRFGRADTLWEGLSGRVKEIEVAEGKGKL
jgi:hypothetical protein